MYYLQNRWKLEENKLYYYGLRNKENMFKNTVKLSKKQAEIISALPSELTDQEKVIMKPLIGTQIVDENHLIETPKSIREAHFCKN